MMTNTDKQALDLPALVDAIGRALNTLDPRGWTRTSSDLYDEGWPRRCHTLKEPTNAEELDLQVAHHGRLVVSVSYPQRNGTWYRPRGDDAPPTSITVAANKPAETIAKDIVRRLLPGYRAALPGYLAALRADEAGQDQARVVANELADLVGAHRPRVEDRPSFTLYPTANSVYKVQVDHGGRVRIETSGLPLDTARAILETLCHPTPEADDDAGPS